MILSKASFASITRPGHSRLQPIHPKILNMRTNLTNHPGSNNSRIVAALCAAFALSFCTYAQGQTLTRWIGAYNGNWATASLWSAGLPNATSGVAVIDSTSSTPGIQIVSTGSCGQLRVVSPPAAAYVTSSNNTSGKPLSLTPTGAGLDYIGLDMSNATVNLSFTSGATKFLIVALGSSQYWNVNGSSLNGDLTIGAIGSVTRVSMGPWTLFANVGSGRTIDATGGLFYGTGGILIKTGAGEMKLGQANTYTGATTVQAGTLTFSTIANIGTASSNLGGPTTVSNGTIAIGSDATGATLKYTGSGHSSDRAISLAGTMGGATLDASGTGALNLSGTAAIATGAGSKTLTLTGTNTGANTLAGIVQDNSPANKTSLAKSGAGEWILSGNNSYTGDTTVTTGTLSITTPFLAASSAVRLTTGAVMDLNFSGSNSIAELYIDGSPQGPGTYNSGHLALGSFFTGGGSLTVSSPGIPPVITSLNPANGASGVGLAANLVLTFDKSVQKGTGNIVIKQISDNSTVETFDVATSGQVTVNGAQVIIDPSSNLAYNTGYYVEIASGAIQDTSSANFAGFSGGSTWNFTTELAPAIATLSPLDDATGVVVTGNLVITFNKNVTKGTGNIVIKDSGDNVVETIAVTSTNVTVNGAQVTINPVNNLAYAAGYYVQIDSGAFTDSLGGNYAGIADTTTWSFTTESAPVIATLNPLDNSTGVVITSNLVLTFDKVVTKGTGNIVIRKTSENSEVDGIDVTSGQVTVSGAVVTINPVNNLDYATGYYVQIDSTAFVGFGGIADTTTWNFTTESAPVIATLNPLDNSTGVVITSNLVLTFDKVVTKRTGNIVIRKTSDNSDFEVIDVTSTKVTVSGAVVTINPVNNLDYATGYYVQIDSTAFVGFAGIADTATWNFTTESAPVIAGLSPADDATAVPTTTNLVITFDKTAFKGTGNIVIRKTSDDSVFETIDATSGQVTASGTQVTINPDGVFALGTGYYALIDAGAIVGFAGIADTTRWNFITTGEAPAIVRLWPPDGATSVETDPNLALTFDKEVGKGTGNIVIRKSSDNSVFETIAVTDAKVTISGARVTINPAGTLDYATGYYVEIDNGAIAGFTGIAGNSAWNFTTWQNLGQTYRRWSGSSSAAWATAANWTGADVPNTASEGADIDGDNGGQTEMQWPAADQTIGQLRIVAPATTTRLYGVYGTNSTRYLTLTPTSFGGIGLDMSQATVDFGITLWNSTRRMIVRLGSDQQWNVTSTSPSGGNLNLLYSQQDPAPQPVDLQGYALTANVGSGRMINATYGIFQGTGGSIIKTGAGTLILGQANTYTGTTAVNGGTLLVNRPGSLAAGTVTVASSATFGGTGTAGGAVTFGPGAKASLTVTSSGGANNTTPMTITGVMTYNATVIHLNLPAGLPNGTYDLATSSATPIQNGAFPTPVVDSGSYQSGSSGQITLDTTNNKLVLTVAEGAGTGTYGSWIGTYFGSETDPAIIGANADPDGDGVPNGIEFLTGSVPNDPSSHNAPSITRNGSGNLVVTFQRADAANIYDVFVQYGSDLQTWSDIPVPKTATAGPPVTVVENGTAPDDITVIVPGPPATAKFARVRIDLTP